MAKKADNKTGEITQADDVYTIDQLKEAVGIDPNYVPKTWEELEAAMEDRGGLLIFEGSPYMVIDKKRLEGVPFAINDIRIWPSTKFGNDVVTLMVMTREPIDERTHFVINDGSTGIAEQVKGMLARSGRRSGIICPNGLRASHYTKVLQDPFGNEEDKEVEATTYYIQ